MAEVGPVKCSKAGWVGSTVLPPPGQRILFQAWYCQTYFVRIVSNGNEFAVLLHLEQPTVEATTVSVKNRWQIEFYLLGGEDVARSCRLRWLHSHQRYCVCEATYLLNGGSLLSALLRYIRCQLLQKLLRWHWHCCLLPSAMVCLTPWLPGWVSGFSYRIVTLCRR